jgi:hypothetical protein
MNRVKELKQILDAQFMRHHEVISTQFRMGPSHPILDLRLTESSDLLTNNPRWLPRAHKMTTLVTLNGGLPGKINRYAAMDASKAMELLPKLKKYNHNTCSGGIIGIGWGKDVFGDGDNQPLSIYKLITAMLEHKIKNGIA